MNPSTTGQSFFQTIEAYLVGLIMSDNSGAKFPDYHTHMATSAGKENSSQKL